MDKINSGLLSHPDRLLEEHINSVIKLSLKFFEKDNIYNEILKDILTIISFSHDIGKSTDYFQEYIKGDKTLRNRPETKHALLGGVIGLCLTERYLSSKNINDLFLLSLGFILPKRHHGNLGDFLNEVILEDTEIELLKNQINAIDKEKFNVFLNNLNIKNKDLLKFSFEDIDFDKINKKLREIKRFIRNLKEKKSLDYYLNTLLLFSLLLDADKSDVGIKIDKSILFKDIDLESNIVDSYVRALSQRDNKINNLRKKAFEEITNQDIDINNKILTITLPTGIGKTLISFKLALKIAEKVKKERGIDLKIIYSLPFLSVIEQNHNVFEKVLKHSKISVDNTLLLKYHHLTGFSYREKEDEFDYDSSRILIEGFNSKIITTTFMQFFYSIFTNKNKMIRKFHRFTNSIIILDEIQSIPHKYWLLINEFLTKMAEKFNFYVILSTATQPFIFENSKELAINSNYYFENLNRYNIYINKTPQTIEAFCSNLDIKPDKSYLFILNTVNSAKELYERLKNQFNQEEITFLSTYIIPKERFKRIKEIQEGKKRIVVSTQLVEAGVDIDFDVVYRDFAPLDSLIQSAGRCNRNSNKSKGNFYIINLVDNNNKEYSFYVYDAVLISITKSILYKDYYEEKDILNLVHNFYNEIQKRKSDKISIDLLNMLYSLKFDGEKEKNKITSIKDFVLIEEDYYKEDIFVEVDEEAQKIWKEFCQIIQIRDIFEKKKAFDDLKAKFYQYIISVPIKDNTPHIENGFYYVPYSNLEYFYDLETGFKIKDKFYFGF
ncbi:CRISPR-associated helicase/endonuclease Cas3 [Venenivibrio stagnispumantis]|uniref:CRISPR-associated helicase, Cas3 family n=1 Tax=Venenivibrio stagnispumantis TaxID=407998 RepID=A0AA45WJS5_9AQUI|nr:CRISPR-associated helicase Cas3' [Venenivibrio stagnispumantis]MCW4572901.1 CRISPR-associated helicase Cas3' [Venenivibrio stagnispumantis]SMP04135.1 CRISPR-associated helicase, Cas3 family [Venenivibrio stagnispumantis]